MQAADVIHLHWVYSLLSPPGIQRLVELGKPVVWTLHDQRPFTGGCHFSFGCEGFTRDCASCPELRDNDVELAQRVLNDALASLEAQRIVVVTPSRWLADCARRSALFRHSRVEVIPYGLEREIFRPQNRGEARVALELPNDAMVLLFGADNAGEGRKGLRVLAAAVQQCQRVPGSQALQDGRIKLVSFGKGAETALAENLPVQLLGYLDGDARLAQLYAAADLLLCPTLADNLPNVVLEARACGLQVLASRVGGAIACSKESAPGAGSRWAPRPYSIGVVLPVT